jgi:hypothetical protein
LRTGGTEPPDPAPILSDPVGYADAVEVPLEPPPGKPVFTGR